MKTILLIASYLLLCFSIHAQDGTTISDKIKMMMAEKDPAKNVASMQQIIHNYNLDTLKNAEEIDVMKGVVALSYLEVGQFSKFQNYIGQIKNKFNQTSYLNMAADILCKNKKHLAYTETIAKQTITLYESYKNDPSARPANFDIADWNRFMQMAAYPYYDTYAKTLHANAKDQMALFYQEKALKDQELDNLQQSSVELYTTLLVANNQAEKAYDILLKMAKLGKSSLQMDQQLKHLLIKRTGNEVKAGLFLDSLQKNIGKAYQTALAKKMLDLDAPNFTLLDLNGKQVSLASLKGKIVVLDFWATWCMPCIASMPAMEKLSKQHPDVVFLFIATQENGVDAIKRVNTYVKTHRFPINVLMDQAIADRPKLFSTATAYQVKGIPAKMVIDKQGKWRFATDGYTSDAELINELEAMISLAKAQ